MVKNIAIMDSVYEDLAKNKLTGESFSTEIKRLLKCQKKDILQFAGVWKLTDEESKRRHDLVKKMREETDRHILKRVQRSK